MKRISLLVILLTNLAFGQVKGNKTIVTKSYDVSTIESIKINLYAKITIDQSAEENLTITADENLLDLIDREVVDGQLHLDQKEWISPSKSIVITIGAPNLRRVETGTHDITKIVNLDNDYLQIMAPIGNITVEGKTKELRIGAELAKVNALNTEAENVYVNLWSWGQVQVNPINTLWAEVSNDGKLIYQSKPESFKVTKKKGGQVLSLSEKDEVKNPDAVFINFKIKNNSSNRNNFYVVGPKPDGSKFSYGFPMMPNTKRKENWSVGTKVYKVNSLGFRKLLITIKKEDEGKVVDLFD
ncbi:GIN domain-containing protein [Winogradskyella tangerina]|uniref:GIN domain-containing protein n=1 Tax=Winogradskyella tangerina TaxID=2023240 RepID=UPI000DBE35E3|nr:DUF2807 domain-containing protein [Winogradskyella tangerina]